MRPLVLYWAAFAVISCDHPSRNRDALQATPTAASSLAPAAPSPGEARVALRPSIVEHASRHEYEVTGATAAQIRTDIDAKAPRRPDGSWFAGYTEWHIDWRFDFAQSEGSCRVTAPRLTYQVTTTLPHWSAPPGAPAALVDKWAKYRAALEAHEAGHRDVGASAADEIQDELEKSAPKVACPAADAAANADAQAVLAKYHDVEVKYDATTRHGAAQGAVFP